MDIFAWLTGTNAGEFCFTILVSMLPVVELRGAIPFGVARGLPLWAAYTASIIGNMLPVPFIIVYIRRLLKWIRRRLPKLNQLADRLEKKADMNSERVLRYGFWGLVILVAIPLPGTGAWTGAMVSAFLDLRLKKAMPAIFLGVLLAGIAVSILTFGVVRVF